MLLSTNRTNMSPTQNPKPRCACTLSPDMKSHASHAFGLSAQQTASVELQVTRDAHDRHDPHQLHNS